jgi:hypothetical protein
VKKKATANLSTSRLSPKIAESACSDVYSTSKL